MHIFIALTLIMVSCIYIHICQNLSKYTLYVQLTVCQLLLNNAIFKNQRQCIGEGNDNPLQYSCLENSRDGGAWWAAVYGVAQSRTRLKRLSSSSSSRDSVVGYWAKKVLAFTTNTTNPTGIYSVTYFTFSHLHFSFHQPKC